MQADHYALLGVAEGAAREEIDEAYRRWLARVREDIGRGQAASRQRIPELRAAYRVLSDPQARRAYDLGRLSAAETMIDRGAGATVAAAAAVAAAPAVRRPALRFAFGGTGEEYFRIWIVNLFLTLLTLGVYSAWAKVRRERYFHRHAMLDGSGFDYHGSPLAILKGRGVAVVLLGLVLAAEQLGEVAHLVAVTALVLAAPWLAVRAFRFRAHNTSYRGLRFSFQASYGAAFKVFVGYGALAFASFGVLFPIWLREQKKFVLDHLSYGSARFSCQATKGQFAWLYAVPMALAALGMLGALKLIGAVPALVVPLVLQSPLIYLMLGPLFAAATANLVWNHTMLGPHRFASDMRTRAYLGIAVSNLVLTLLTLGLYRPWAKVRLARYRAEHLALQAEGSLDEFVAGQRTAAAALGDEASELFDLDVAL